MKKDKLIQVTRHSAGVSSVAELELLKARHAIEQFIYSCSHTMRGPLKSIAGLVYLLKNTPQVPAVDPGFYLQSIEKTVVKLETVLNDLEYFLTNSREDITTHSVNVKALIQDVLKEFESIVRDKSIATEITVKQLAPLYTDEGRLRIVLSHIISNAVTYQDLKKKDRRLTVAVKITQVTCCVRISDNGIGIRDEIQSNIFDLFFRGSESSVGAGVGLYVAKELVCKLEGVLSVTSKSGKDTCFTCSVPNLSA